MEFPWNKPEPEPEPEPEPTDPVLPCGVELLECQDGRVVVLDRARVVHSIDGTVVRGYVVDQITGATTGYQTMVPFGTVVRHVALGWRNSDSTLHEMSDVTPASLTRK